MQVVILAAGMGKRLKSKTAEHTKSMVQILGKTFLEHSLDKLTKFDISKIILVIGYCGDEIKQVIGDEYNGVPVVYVENEIYDKTNNIYSLYLTKDYLEKEDTLLLESDLIYEESILKTLLENPCPNLAVVDKYKSYMDGTVVKINENNEITQFVPKQHFNYKEISEYYKTVNIYKFSKEFLQKEYLPFLEAYCKSMGNNQYYEQVLKVLLTLEKNNLKALPLKGEKWYEVDDLQDYDIAECMFCDDLDERLSKYHSRYGGYWRFNEVKDFCYLVNPYFPPKRMITELKYNFEDLLTNYPSGQSIHKILVSNIWGVKDKYVLVGNGAAELINCIVPELEGNIGVVLPTFQEYPARIKKGKIVELLPDNPDFAYTKDDLIKFADKIDTLVLVNPDNPSGNYITKEDVVELAKYYKEKGKKLILDESFVDFTEGVDSNSLINEKIIEENDNLIIIKSISKSYGVPGLRLGIAVSSDVEFLNKCYKNMPVWNINSYAEGFLQILNKYMNQYSISCEKIVYNRGLMFEGLKEIKSLRPIKSQSNYILCEVLAPYNSKQICKKLLERGFLIKDCQNKMGFNGKQYVRIAVKSKHENKELLEVLKEL